MTGSQGISSGFILAFSFLTFLTLFQVVHECTADEPDPVVSEGHEPVDCLRILMRAAKKTMKSITSCSRMFKENTTSNKEYGDKLACILKCAMQKIQLVDEDGHANAVSIRNMMKDYIPDEVMLNQVKDKVVDGCAHLAVKLDPLEENCKSYAAYSLCLQMAVEEYKDTSPLCIKKKKKHS